MALTFEARSPDGSVTAKLPGEADTLDLGARLAAALRPGLLVYLSGELGAGKTTLVRGCLRALGYRGRVKSPTFTLVEVYRLSSLYLHHFDFYRFSDPREWTDAGFRDVFGGDNTCLVEWPERAGNELPPADLAIRLEHAGDGRVAHITAHTGAGAACLDRLIA
ncbi:MAG TPA: tRNA (adenosine(37)-N6)-threonylcarbamoyltransferase complex ATPase subunit type 1 TsaE [Burkholderiales bacterium]|nr:tRNA (adenosine(37)-N6)-threonylcarbamoyltransferase complex ATPase subunit type 1 TsaE [Burkholderiales bacterium]